MLARLDLATSSGGVEREDGMERSAGEWRGRGNGDDIGRDDLQGLPLAMVLSHACAPGQKHKAHWFFKPR